MQAEPQDIDRRLQQGRVGTGHQGSDRAVRGHHGPVAINREGRVRFMPLEYKVDGLARAQERGVGQLPLAKYRSVSGCHQQHVALAQRDFQPLGQMQHHLAARLRASRLNEAQVPGGYIGLAGEIELAQTPALAPFAQKIADRLCGAHHQATITRSRRRTNYLRGNRARWLPACKPSLSARSSAQHLTRICGGGSGVQRLRDQATGDQSEWFADGVPGP